jgi:hypothetical protein
MSDQRLEQAAALPGTAEEHGTWKPPGIVKTK